MAFHYLYMYPSETNLSLLVEVIFFFQSSTVISEYDTTNQKGILMNLTVYTVRILTVYIVRTETV